MNRLAPLCEEPVSEEDTKKLSKRGRRNWKNWVRTQFSLLFFHKRSDLQNLMSVLGCPLFPISSSSSSFHHHPAKSLLEVSSSARYIIEHFRAATGCKKLEGHVKNIFATGKVSMTMVEEPGSNNSPGPSHKGCFVMWQMVPNKWLIELVVGTNKVLAGSDGKLAWRYTPWLGSHAAKGSVRPLRRALQGLDPMLVSQVFSQAQYMGEKEIMGVDCFALKLSADHADLADRSDSAAEMIKHVTFGYFSQKCGLLVYLEDSYLTRIHSPGTCPIYWETTMGSKIEDYRMVDDVMIGHSGQTHAIITRFGDNLKTGPMVLRMEEAWAIDDLAFNVPGLSLDCFIPPQEVQGGHIIDHQYSPLDH